MPVSETPAADWRRTGRFCLAAFCMDAANGMFLVVLPYLAQDLGADSMDLGLLAAVRGGAYMLACLTVARLADRRNRKVLVAAAAVGVGLAFLGTAGAGALWHLGATTLFWAVSLSFYWPSLFAWLGDAHPPERLARATAAVNVSWSTGGILGGLAAGWLFLLNAPLPLWVALAPVALAAGTMLLSPCAHGRPQPPTPRRRVPGARRVLAAVWIGNAAICSLLGLLGGVFPRLGGTLGVDAAGFGLLMAGLGLGRTAVFFAGFRHGDRMHGWPLAAATQLLAAALVASVARADSSAWFFVVFLGLGAALGVNYFRGLYKSLENAGLRGLKSGLHEATLLGGVLLGSLLGGAMAKGYGLRAPYVPVACLAVVLTAVQGALLLSARSARRAGAVAVATQARP